MSEVVDCGLEEVGNRQEAVENVLEVVESEPEVVASG